MKKILQKSYTWLIMLVAMFAMSGSAWAESETINLSSSSWNGTYVTISGTNGSSMSVDAGLAIFNAYKGTFTAKSGYKITKMQFYYTGYYTGTPNVSEGRMSSETVWENASGSSSIVFSSTTPIIYSRVTVTVEAAGSSAPVKPDFPVENTPYQIKSANADLYINLIPDAAKGTILDVTPEAVYFTWDEAHSAFTVKDGDGNYMGGHTNNWNMSSTTPEYWTVENTNDGYAFLSTSADVNKHLGFDKLSYTAAGFRNKSVATNGKFYIEPYNSSLQFDGIAMNFVKDLTAPVEKEKDGVTVSGSSQYSWGNAGLSILHGSYNNRSATFTSSQPITKIALTGLANMNYIEASVGNWNPSTGIWTGYETSVTFSAKYDQSTDWHEYDDYIEMAMVWVDPIEIVNVSVKGYDSEENKYYGTFYSEYDWVVPTGCTAYVVTDVANGQMTLTTLAYAGDVVAHEHAVILQSDYSIESTPAAIGNSAYPIQDSRNMLGGSLTTQIVGGDGAKYYALSKKNNKLGFYWDPVTQDEGATVECPAHKAYLRVPVGNGASNALSFRFDDIVTDINSANIERENAPVYNLQGQRVNATEAGVYVKNGKKIIVK